MDSTCSPTTFWKGLRRLFTSHPTTSVAALATALALGTAIWMLPAVGVLALAVAAVWITTAILVEAPWEGTSIRVLSLGVGLFVLGGAATGHLTVPMEATMVDGARSTWAWTAHPFANAAVETAGTLIYAATLVAVFGLAVWKLTWYIAQQAMDKVCAAGRTPVAEER
jgi:hypothetical protein